jgi:hypothetical protein
LIKRRGFPQDRNLPSQSFLRIESLSPANGSISPVSTRKGASSI